MTTAGPEIQPLPPLGSIGRVTRLFHRRATWVLVDQGVVSAGNFLTGILLTRYLPKPDLGNYGVLLETLFYLNSLQAALIVYPLTVKGATGDRANLGRLATASILLTLALLPILGGATLVAVFAAQVMSVFIAAALALLLWQLQETMRRALMADLRFGSAIWGDALRWGAQTVGVLWLGHSGLLTLNRVFLVIGITSAMGAVLQAIQVGLRSIRFWQLRLVIRDFWRLGRWMLLTNGSGIITSLGYWWTLRMKHGAEPAAVLTAIVLPFKLANPLINSMSALIVPAVARASATAGMKAATRIAIRYIAFGAVLMIPYLLFMAVFPSLTLRIFVPNPEYRGETLGLQLFTANYLTVFISAMFGAWLAGLGRARWSFYAQVTNIIATLLVGLPATILWGVHGLILSSLFASGVGAAATLYFIRHVTAPPPTPDVEPPPAAVSS